MNHSFFLGLVLSFSLIQAGVAAEKTSIDGNLIHRRGAEYRVVTNPNSQEVKVYVKKNKTRLPSELVLQIKRDGKVLDRIRLDLTEKDSERAHYLGIVPAKISVSGGITFGLD